MVKRAICHEAGHAVVALHLGFVVGSIAVRNGSPICMIDLHSSERTLSERFVVLTGGIAGELFVCGDYDRHACISDEDQISRMGGEAIASYLPEALKIIRASEAYFGWLRARLTAKWIEGAADCMFTPGEVSFELLSQTEIKSAWRAG